MLSGEFYIQWSLQNRPTQELLNSKRQYMGNKASGIDSLKDQEIIHYRKSKRFLFLIKDNNLISGYVETDHAEAHLAQVATTIAVVATSGVSFNAISGRKP